MTWKKLGLLSGLLILTACAAQQTPVAPINTVATDSFCVVLGGPVIWSKDDTVQTVEQVKKINAKWDAICGK